MNQLNLNLGVNKFDSLEAKHLRKVLATRLFFCALFFWPLSDT